MVFDKNYFEWILFYWFILFDEYGHLFYFFIKFVVQVIDQSLIA